MLVVGLFCRPHRRNRSWQGSQRENELGKVDLQVFKNLLLNALLQVLRLIKVLRQPSISVKKSLCSLGLSLLQQQDLCETTVKQVTEQVLFDSHMLVFSVLLECNHCVLHLQLPAISSNNLNYYYSSGNSCRTPFQIVSFHVYKHTL